LSDGGIIDGAQQRQKFVDAGWIRRLRNFDCNGLAEQAES
jgi:hypothetical protein